MVIHMISPSAHLEADMIRPRVSVGSPFPAQVIRSVLVRQCTSIVVENQEVMGVMTAGQVVAVTVAEQSVKQMAVRGLLLEAEPIA